MSPSHDYLFGHDPRMSGHQTTKTSECCRTEPRHPHLNRSMNWNPPHILTSKCKEPRKSLATGIKKSLSRTEKSSFNHTDDTLESGIGTQFQRKNNFLSVSFKFVKNERKFTQALSRALSDKFEIAVKVSRNFCLCKKLSPIISRLSSKRPKRLKSEEISTRRSFFFYFYLKFSFNKYISLVNIFSSFYLYICRW